MIAEHTPHVSVLCDLLCFDDVLINLDYFGFMEMICINDLFI